MIGSPFGGMPNMGAQMLGGVPPWMLGILGQPNILGQQMPGAQRQNGVMPNAAPTFPNLPTQMPSIPHAPQMPTNLQTIPGLMSQFGRGGMGQLMGLLRQNQSPGTQAGNTGGQSIWSMLSGLFNGGGAAAPAP